MERDDLWARAIAAAGAIGAAVALVYLVGGASLSFRYEGFGLPGQQAAALTPREVLIAAGLRTLIIWTVIGLGVVLGLRVLGVRAVPDAFVRALAQRLRSPLGYVGVAVILLALLLLLHVWWPLAAFAGLLAVVLAHVYWESRPVRRALVSALSIAVVAVAYEADRISYLVEWTCVTVVRDGGTPREPAAARRPASVRTGQHICGTLIGQQDRGFYLGVPGTVGRVTAEAEPYRLTFIPAGRVEQAQSRKQLAHVTSSRAEARRESLVSRLFDLHVR